MATEIKYFQSYLFFLFLWKSIASNKLFSHISELLVINTINLSFRNAFYFLYFTCYMHYLSCYMLYDNIGCYML